jgi:hypothetical protein
MVTFEVPLPPLATDTEGVATEQVVPVGDVHVRATAPLKAFTEATFTVVEPPVVLPGVTGMMVVFAVIEKSDSEFFRVLVSTTAAGL